MPVSVNALGQGLVRAPLREVLGHWALDILREGADAIVLCVICGGTWEEGGYPPDDCSPDRYTHKRKADAST